MPAPTVPGPVTLASTPVRPTWTDRWTDYRNRLLCSARFRSWAMRLPLLRHVARRDARRTFQLIAGFVNSQVLHACLQLGLLQRLAEQPQTGAQLAKSWALDMAAAQRLLDAAESLRLVQPGRDGRYRLGRLGTALSSDPGLQLLSLHHQHLYHDLADPVALLRGEVESTRLSRYWPYARADSSQADGDATGAAVADYTRLMAASQPMVAQSVIDSGVLRGTRNLLDLGGGNGSFARAVLNRYPQMAATVFDLPEVVALAHDMDSGSGVPARLSTLGGNFFLDSLPAGHDTISLVRIVHDHDDAPVTQLLRRVYQALPEGGRLIVAEPMLGAAGAEEMGGAYFGFYLLAMGSGRPRTAAELSQLLRDAGFRTVQQRKTPIPLICSVLEARK